MIYYVEIEWTSKVYDIDACILWKEQVLQEQLRVWNIFCFISPYLVFSNTIGEENDCSENERPI